MAAPSTLANALVADESSLREATGDAVGKGREAGLLTAELRSSETALKLVRACPRPDLFVANAEVAMFKP